LFIFIYLLLCTAKNPAAIVKCEVGGVFRCCAQHYLEYLRSQSDFCVECDFALNLNTLPAAVRNPLFNKKRKTRKLGLSAIKIIRVSEYAMQRGEPNQKVQKMALV
jgi:hypothetical protein